MTNCCSLTQQPPLPIHKNTRKTHAKNLIKHLQSPSWLSDTNNSKASLLTNVRTWNRDCLGKDLSICINFIAIFEIHTYSNVFLMCWKRKEYNIYIYISLRSAAVISRQPICTKRALYFNQISYGLTIKFCKSTSQKYCLSHQ